MTELARSTPWRLLDFLLRLHEGTTHVYELLAWIQIANIASITDMFLTVAARISAMNLLKIFTNLTLRKLIARRNKLARLSLLETQHWRALEAHARYAFQPPERPIQQQNEISRQDEIFAPVKQPGWARAGGSRPHFLVVSSTQIQNIERKEKWTRTGAKVASVSRKHPLTCEVGGRFFQATVKCAARLPRTVFLASI